MKIWPWVAGLAGASAATLLYGAAVEAYRLSVERVRLSLPRWPASLDGYTIALLADFHVRDQGSLDLARRAVDAAIAAEPNAIALAGDAIDRWRLDTIDYVIAAHEALSGFQGPKIAVPGNHDHRSGQADWLRPVYEELGIQLLANEMAIQDGIAWIGVDSAIEHRANPFIPFMQAEEEAPELPKIVLWHEPDFIDWLPTGAALVLSGHSHGGQFTFPWGWTPMYTKGGAKYPRGFYPDAPTPIYVSRGIGVTGPPSRLCCAPEVSILELVNDAR